MFFGLGVGIEVELVYYVILLFDLVDYDVWVLGGLFFLCEIYVE